MPERPATPRGLRKGGQKLWRDTVGIYDLRADERAVLEQACRQVDLIDRLAAELEGQELIVPGSKGQMSANPLISELRLQRKALDGLLRGLQLPDEGPQERTRPRDKAGRFRSPVGVLPRARSGDL